MFGQISTLRIAAAMMVLMALSCEEQEDYTPNHPPLVVSVGVVEGGIPLGETGTLVCYATDEDNDSLTYTWTAYTGLLEGVGNQVSWTPPDRAARYPFMILVEDGRGGFAEREFDVQVFGAGSQTWQVYTTSNSEIPSNYVLTLAVDHNDIVWIGDRFSHVTSFENNNWNSWSLPSGEIISLAFDSADQLWIGSDNWPLTRFDGNEFHEYLPGMNARTIAVDHNDEIWVGNYSGLSKFSGTEWVHYTPDNSGLPYIHVNSITPDDNGVLWCVASDPNSGTSAVVQFDGVTWIQHPVNGAVSMPGSIAIDQQGQVWVGTQTGVALYDQLSWSYYPSPDNLISVFGDLAIDMNGYVWCATNAGLLKFDGVDWTVFTAENSQVPYGWVTSLAIDTKGNKWLGSYGFGVAVYNENGIH